jgi:hypothetical protein
MRMTKVIFLNDFFIFKSLNLKLQVALIISGLTTLTTFGKWKVEKPKKHCKKNSPV